MAISEVALSNAAKAMSSSSQTVLPAAPDGVAVAQFQELMNAPAAAPDDPAPVPDVGATAAPPSSPVQPFNIGDKILAGLGKIGNDMQSSLGKVDAALHSGSELGTANLLKANMELMEYSLKLQFAGKLDELVTSRTDQLLHLQ